MEEELTREGKDNSRNNRRRRRRNRARKIRSKGVDRR